MKGTITENPVQIPTDDPSAAVKTAAESKYSANELADAARTRFKVPPEVVTAALKTAGKTEATVAETKQIIKEFMDKKVE